MPKVYLSPSDQEKNVYGAGNTNEEVQCRRIAVATEKALKRCGFEVKNNMTGDMYARVEESNEWGSDLHMPIHTNAFNKKVAGTRIFSYDMSGEGYRAAKDVFQFLAPVTPGTSESITARPGLYEVNSANAPTVYIEVDFHDVPDVALWIINNVEKIAEAICKGVCKYFGVKYVQPTSTETKPQQSTSGKLYRVQIGAYENEQNAKDMQKKLKAAGFDAIIKVEDTKNDSIKVETPKEVTLKEGDKVKMQSGAPVYGKSYSFEDWVYKSTLYVREVDGDAIVVSTVATGPITGTVHKKYLTKI